jgi:hypothetical protein
MRGVHDGGVDDLASRLAALDPEASAALKVIRHFDSLLESRAGLQSVVRGAAALAGATAGLVDPARRLTVRVGPDGVAAAPVGPPDPAWVRTEVTDNGAEIWLERFGPVDTVDAVILERAAGVARSVLERTRSRAVLDDPALVELVLDAKAPEPDRLAAGRRLGLGALARPVARAGAGPLVVGVDRVPPLRHRAGIGPAVRIADLPGAAESARLALRLTAEGGPEDPGPRVLYADRLGTLLLVVQAADADSERHPDVRALDKVMTEASWMPAVLEAVTTTESLRDAARSLGLHHSTLQDRVAHAEHLLGWGRLRSPAGRLRLQLAIALRRALRSR